MSLIIQHGGSEYRVPRDVEARGGAAMKKWLAEQTAPKKPKTKPRREPRAQPQPTAPSPENDG